MPARNTTSVPALTREQCRAVDRYAIEQLGIPGIVLMENAGRNAANLIERWAGERMRRRGQVRLPRSGPSGASGTIEPDPFVSGTVEPDPFASGTIEPGPLLPVCIVCGKGNNGGDGFVIARHLFNRGWPVCVDLAAEPLSLAGDAAINHRIVERMGVPIRELNGAAALDQAAARWGQAAVVVDALLGTGFAGEVREPMAGIINRINAVATKSLVTAPLVVAADVPSGLDADTGTAAGPAIRAERTITFLAAKVGYKNKSARPYLGRVTICDIGAPTELILKCLGTLGNTPTGR